MGGDLMLKPTVKAGLGGFCTNNGHHLPTIFRQEARVRVGQTAKRRTHAPSTIRPPGLDIAAKAVPALFPPFQNETSTRMRFLKKKKVTENKTRFRRKM